uniref:Uncharacterized protein n=1 Tax=Arundo donax TaxID=35708 RepID=A0A0A9AAA0_ARUDO
MSCSQLNCPFVQPLLECSWIYQGFLLFLRYLGHEGTHFTGILSRQFQDIPTY